MTLCGDGGHARVPVESRSYLPMVDRPDGLFLGKASVVHLALMAGLPVVIGAWLLLSPERLLSREMTWDLLFNLSGAWRIEHGHVPHVDYHDPVGVLGFILTRLGFYIVGPKPHAFLVGEAAFLALTFATASVAAWRRLPPIPAAMFVVYVSLLVLMPVNVGDQLNAYSFAMYYNRWAWSAITTLCLILFLAPRAGRQVAWVDAATGGLLLLTMFYLKITFAAAGLAAVVLAMMVAGHVRAAWRTWGIVFGVVVANALAPHSHAYLSDIWEGAQAGYPRDFWQDHLRTFFTNRAEHALYGGGVLLLLWLWRQGKTSLTSVIAAVFIVFIGMFLLSQNAQPGSMPVGMVVAFLVYDAVRTGWPTTPTFGRGTLLCLVAGLLFPALSIASAAASLVGYHLVAMRDTGLMTVSETNLRNMAVPTDEDGLPRAFAVDELSYELQSRPREFQPRYEITQFEYVQTLVEAASLFRGGKHGSPRILVLDQVNPLPFMLGYPPARGGNLWLWHGAPERPVDEIFGNADIVLVPKYPSSSRATIEALAKYRVYLSEHFPRHDQTTSWTILRRRTNAEVRPMEPSGLRSHD